MKQSYYYFSIVGIVLTRLFLNAIVPLMDKTEARYAEIARIMYETGNWITPQIDYGIPFWAKPPLSVWLNAISIHLFGVNEFAVRFPSFVISISIWYILSKVFTNRKEKIVLGLVLFTLPQFLLHAGVVSTDMTLLLSLSLVMIGFWLQINSNRITIWGYLIFVGIGLGLLAKGPIVLVLSMPPLFLWVLKFNQWENVWQRIPIFMGFILIGLIAFPWYYLAENKTPGFLDYFIVGEHFKRFVDSSWDGDKYGFAKQQPFGIIWLFFVLLNLPWILSLIFSVFKKFQVKTIFSRALSNPWLFFLFLWTLWTPLFFTSSKSLIHTYMLPSVPGIALLTVYYWKHFKQPIKNIKLAMLLPLLALVIGVISLGSDLMQKYANTDKYSITDSTLKEPLYYLQEKSYSSQFYSEGKIKTLSLKDFIAENYPASNFSLIVKKKFIKRNPTLDFSHFLKSGESSTSIVFLRNTKNER